MTDQPKLPINIYMYLHIYIYIYFKRLIAYSLSYNIGKSQKTTVDNREHGTVLLYIYFFLVN